MAGDDKTTAGFGPTVIWIEKVDNGYILRGDEFVRVYKGQEFLLQAITRWDDGEFE